MPEIVFLEKSIPDTGHPQTLVQIGAIDIDNARVVDN